MRTSTALFAICLVALVLNGTAQARDLPCHSGSLTHKARCIAHQPGLHPAGGTHYALGILRCEGGIRIRYVGPWSLTPDEARVFPKQAPHRWWQRVRDMGRANGYRQTVGVFSHSRKYGWGWSSCA